MAEIRVHTRRYHVDGGESGCSWYQSADDVLLPLGVLQPGDVALVAIYAPGAPSTICQRCFGTRRVLVTPGSRDEPDLGPESAGASPCPSCSSDPA